MIDYNAIKWVDLVYYDETSPTFLRWKVDRRAGKDGRILKKASGDVAGYIGNDKYSRIGLFGKRYLNHRIIWILFNGSIGNVLQIDHIDGDRINSSITNLRLVCRLTNMHNQSAPTNNKTGVVGVSLVKDGKGYHHYVTHWCGIDGKQKQKYFAVLKFGETEAFRLACEYRKRMIDELNAQGAGYTERHGRIT